MSSRKENINESAETSKSATTALSPYKDLWDDGSEVAWVADWVWLSTATGAVIGGIAGYRMAAAAARHSGQEGGPSMLSAGLSIAAGVVVGGWLFAKHVRPA